MPDISFESENVARYSPSTVKSRGQISVDTDNMNYRTQLTKHSVLPMLDRPKPLFDLAKTWTPIIPRVKLLGVFGILDPDEEEYRSQRYGARSAGGAYSVERRIPRPYPYTKFVWAPEKPIARIPSVIASPITTGPTRTVSPQRIRDISRKTVSGRISVQI